MCASERYAIPAAPNLAINTVRAVERTGISGQESEDGIHDRGRSMTSRHGWLLGLALLLGACMGDARKPIATIESPASVAEPAPPLIVVLPGFGSNAKALKDHAVDETIHKAWPQADVLLTSATVSYYRHKVLVQHLEHDVLEPVRRQGYREVWLAGASIGGLGALLYEREHPGAVTGLILFAPWMGPNDLLDEIRQAGGVRQWEPGPVPAKVTFANYQREVWRVVKGWSGNPASANRIWLVCGDEDRLLGAAQLMAAVLPESHYLEVRGGHTWATWLASVESVINEMHGRAPAPVPRSALSQ